MFDIYFSMRFRVFKFTGVALETLD